MKILAEKQVLTALSLYPKTRNDDFELIFSIWEDNGVILTPEQKQGIRNCPPPETIRRTRQKIQEQGMYQADDKTRNRRKKLAQQHTEFHRNYEFFIDSDGNSIARAI